MLTEKQNEAINLLIEGHNKSDVANKVGICRGTLYKWLDDSEFIAESNRRRQKMCDEALNNVKGDINKLLNELEKIALNSENENIRLSAINSLLDRILGRPSTKSEVSIEKTTEKDIDLKELEDTFNMVEDVVDDKVIDLKEKKAN